MRQAPAGRRQSTCSNSSRKNYLRWDSLGEFLALGVSIEDLGHKTGNNTALTLATRSTARTA
jgi:monomeric isocitrate dehydrogenase